MTKKLTALKGGLSMNKKASLMIVFLFVLQALFSAAYANEQNFFDYYSELLTDHSYMPVRMKAYDIKKDEKTGVITFKNKKRPLHTDAPDSNTYYIDTETFIFPYIEGSPYLDDFLSGKAPWVYCRLPKNQYWETSGIENSRIHLPNVTAFSQFLTVDQNNKDPFDRLWEYNIMTMDDTGSFAPDQPVTRAAMAKMLMAAQNITTGPEVPVTFSDVAADHWAAHYIGLAQSAKLINGFEDGTFRPEESVTPEQVVKMVVCLLGYEPTAREKGGYPNGYMAVAKEIGLLDNVKNDEMNVSVCTRQTIAHILDRALDLPLMMPVFISTPEKTEYAVFDGLGDRPLETLLSFYFIEDSIDE